MSFDYDDIIAKIAQVLKTQIETQQPKGHKQTLISPLTKIWPIIETMEKSTILQKKVFIQYLMSNVDTWSPINESDFTLPCIYII